MSALSENNPMANNENAKPGNTSPLGRSPISPVKKGILGNKPHKPMEKKLSKRKFSEENMGGEFNYGSIYDDMDNFDDTEFVSKAVKSTINAPQASSPTPSVAPKLSPMKSFGSKNWLKNLTTAPSKDAVDLQQCILRRVRTTLLEKMYPTYECYDSDGRLLMIAKKMKLGAAYNIYGVEETSTPADASLSPKKTEFHIGKLKGVTNDNYVLYNFDTDPTEICVINLDRVVSANNNTDYVPRQLTIALPQVNKENKCIGNIVGKAGDKGENTGTSLIESLAVALSNEKYNETEPVPLEPLIFKTKCPYLKDGKYYLNFHGRVKLGSLKNFQLVAGHQTKHQETRLYTDLSMQFGKLSNDDFNMDFKYPLNYMQALAIALTQFEI